MLKTENIRRFPLKVGRIVKDWFQSIMSDKQPDHEEDDKYWGNYIKTRLFSELSSLTQDQTPSKNPKPGRLYDLLGELLERNSLEPQGGQLEVMEVLNEKPSKEFENVENENVENSEPLNEPLNDDAVKEFKKRNIFKKGVLTAATVAAIAFGIFSGVKISENKHLYKQNAESIRLYEKSKLEQQKQKENYESKLAASEKIVLQVCDELKIKNAELEKIKQERDNYKKILEDKKIDPEKLLELDGIISQLDAEIKAEKLTVLELNKKLVQVNQEHEDLQEQYRQQSEEAKSLIEKVEKYEQKIAEDKARWSELNQKLDELCKEKEGLRAKLEQEKERMVEIENKNRELEALKTATEVEKAFLAQLLKEKEEQIVDLQVKMLSLETQVKDYENMLRTKDGEFQKLMSENEKIFNEKARIEKENAIASQRMAQLEDQIKHQYEEVEQLKKSYEGQLRKVEDEVSKKFSDQIGELKQNLNQVLYDDTRKELEKLITNYDNKIMAVLDLIVALDPNKPDQQLLKQYEADFNNLIRIRNSYRELLDLLSNTPSDALLPEPWLDYNLQITWLTCKIKAFNDEYVKLRDELVANMQSENNLSEIISETSKRVKALEEKIIMYKKDLQEVIALQASRTQSNKKFMVKITGEEEIGSFWSLFTKKNCKYDSVELQVQLSPGTYEFDIKSKKSKKWFTEANLGVHVTGNQNTTKVTTRSSVLANFLNEMRYYVFTIKDDGTVTSP